MSNNILNNLQNDIIQVLVNFKNLKDTIKNSTDNIGIISQLRDLEEIASILNEKICDLDNKINKNNVELSKYALERLNNNEIVCNAIKPYIPYIILNLYDLNNT